MKKVFCLVLILATLCTLSFSFGCSSGRKGAELYDPSKYTETIDLENDYTLVWSDEFEEELDRNVWADTRHGTRRDGFWTRNLAFTDGEGNLIIRTEKRGSRYCSDTQERQVTGYNGSTVKLCYDDCNPFAMIAGDFGEIGSLGNHTDDLIGYVILDKFDLLGEEFAAFTSAFSLPSGNNVTIPVDSDLMAAYAPFYETAMNLFNYYSFVVDTKRVDTAISQSAVIGITHSYSALFGANGTAPSAEYRSVLSKLFGFSSEAEFVACATALSERYTQYALSLSNGGNVVPGLENGCFHTNDDVFIFPLAIQNQGGIVLTYVIVDKDGMVSVWVNNMEAALKAINYSADYFTNATVTNETYCKNTLFVTGPEGVYSGALRTLPVVGHEGNTLSEGYTHGYGYYEIRCKLPNVQGIWHAFWMMCGNVYSVENGSTDGVEIDVFEYLPARDAVNVALHWDGYDEEHKNAHKRFEKTGFADDEYHTFGMNWDENGYTFYIDGRKVYTTKGGGVCDQEGYLKISTEYGEWGSWVANLDQNDLPVDWVIDYVRVYDKK